MNLFDETPYFFQLSNLPKKTAPARSFVKQSNDRCGQENVIAQLTEMTALSALQHDLASNEVYMDMATLAWNLKCGLGLSITDADPTVAKEKRRAETASSTADTAKLGPGAFRGSCLSAVAVPHVTAS